MNAINCYVYSRIDLNKFTKSLISLCLTLFVDNQAKGSTITRFNFIFHNTYQSVIKQINYMFS